MTRIRFGVIAAAIVLAACTPQRPAPIAAPVVAPTPSSVEVLPAPSAPPSAPPITTSGGKPVARVGDRVFTGDDVVRHLFRTQAAGAPGTTLRQQAFAALNQLVVREVVDQEVRKHGLTVPDAWVEEQLAKSVEDLALRALKAYGKGATPESFVRLEYRQSLDDWKAARRDDLAERWKLSRVVRFDGMRTDRVELQIILVDDEATAKEIAAKLDAGADMAALAMKHSVHETARAGGRMPPVARESLAPAVADRAFSLAPGQRTGVLSVDDGSGKRRFEIVRLLRRLPAKSVSWAEAAPEIEAGLTAEPVGTLEFLAWNLRIERLYNLWIDGTL